MTTPRKAVALISGGLDSMLAARLILNQGVHVEGINFFTGFCVEGHTHAIRTSKQDKQPAIPWKSSAPIRARCTTFRPGAGCMAMKSSGPSRPVKKYV